MLAYLIALLTVLGIHRLWNYEDVFAPVRLALGRAQIGLRSAGWLMSPMLCPACNPVWIGAVVGAVAWSCGVLTPWEFATLPLAAYPLVRGAVALYATRWAVPPSVFGLAPPAFQRPTAPPTDAAVTAPAAPKPAPPVGDPKAVTQVAGTCTSCAENAKRMADERAFSDTFEQRIVLMTALAAWDSSYSLVSVILDQARMLARNPKRLVSIWAMENADLTKVPTDLPPNVIVRPYVPNTNWAEDVIDEVAARRLAGSLQMRLFNLGNATVITHDLLFVSWYATFAKALHTIGGTRAFAWIHQIHSCTGGRPPEAVAQYRATLPAGHLIAVVSPTEATSAAEYYQTALSNVVVIPNARDMRSFGTTPQASALLNRTGLLAADVAQTLPLSSPRMESKGVMRTIRAMAALHRAGASTHLLIAEAHANDAGALLRRRGIRALVAQLGLPDDAVSFSAEILPATAALGLDAPTIRQLMQASNAFIFASVSESAGLVALEAALCGNLVVLNSNVPALAHAAAAVQHSLAFPFPSARAPSAGEPDYDDLAAQVLGRLIETPARLAQRAFGFDAVAPQLERAVAAAKPVA